MSEERAFVENLVNTRLNFLLLFVSIVAASALAADVPDTIRATVLSVAAFFAFLLSASVVRAQQKLEIIFQYLRDHDPEHPAIIIDNLAPKSSRRRWIGYLVPRLCWIVLAIGAATAWIAPHLAN